MLNLPSQPLAGEPVDIGVFGGSGFYHFDGRFERIAVDTPYGPPSAEPVVGEIDGRRIAFMARHGEDHQIPAHRVNYRANVWTMAALGVHALVSPFACGSLEPTMRPGDLVLVDQLVDRTSGREGTFFDGPELFHLQFADPYDPALSAQLADAAEQRGLTVHRGGTVVVIGGPRFSTRAEASWHRTMGWHLVNMTQVPEVQLAREANIAIVGIGMVTDYDVGLDGDPGVKPVTMDSVFEVLRRNADSMRELLRDTLSDITLPAAAPARTA